MTAPRDEGQENRSESAQVRVQLREHIEALASVVAELREIADIPPVQQEAEHPRTTGAPDHERTS